MLYTYVKSFEVPKGSIKVRIIYNEETLPKDYKLFATHYEDVIKQDIKAEEEFSCDNMRHLKPGAVIASQCLSGHPRTIVLCRESEVPRQNTDQDFNLTFLRIGIAESVKMELELLDKLSDALRIQKTITEVEYEEGLLMDTAIERLESMHCSGGKSAVVSDTELLEGIEKLKIIEEKYKGDCLVKSIPNRKGLKRKFHETD